MIDRQKLNLSSTVAVLPGSAPFCGRSHHVFKLINAETDAKGLVTMTLLGQRTIAPDARVSYEQRSNRVCKNLMRS